MSWELQLYYIPLKNLITQKCLPWNCFICFKASHQRKSFKNQTNITKCSFEYFFFSTVSLDLTIQINMFCMIKNIPQNSDLFTRISSNEIYKHIGYSNFGPRRLQGIQTTKLCFLFQPCALESPPKPDQNTSGSPQVISCMATFLSNIFRMRKADQMRSCSFSFTDRFLPISLRTTP